jgi:hypothetical protein
MQVISAAWAGNKWQRRTGKDGGSDDRLAHVLLECKAAG